MLVFLQGNAGVSGKNGEGGEMVSQAICILAQIVGEKVVWFAEYKTNCTC